MELITRARAIDGVVLGTMCLLVVFSYFMLTPWPQRVYSWNSGRLLRAANAVQRQHFQGDLSGAELPKELAGLPVTRIRKAGKCVVFQLETSADAANVEIVYSSGGFRDLAIDDPNVPNNRLTELRRIDREGRWHYWVRK